MSDKVMTTTVNADGQMITVVADTVAALGTTVTAVKLYAKPTRPDIKSPADGNKKHSDFN